MLQETSVSRLTVLTLCSRSKIFYVILHFIQEHRKHYNGLSFQIDSIVLEMSPAFAAKMRKTDSNLWQVSTGDGWSASIARPIIGNTRSDLWQHKFSCKQVSQLFTVIPRSDDSDTAGHFIFTFAVRAIFSLDRDSSSSLLQDDCLEHTGI